MEIISGLIGLFVVGGILLYFKIRQTDYELESKKPLNISENDPYKWLRDQGINNWEEFKKHFRLED